MKKIIISLIISIISSLIQVKANNDSLVVKTDSITIDNCIAINNKDILEEQNTSKIESFNSNKIITKREETYKALKIKKNATKPVDFGTFLNNFWDVISSPFKPVWGT
jgi:hypothetical protein